MDRKRRRQITWGIDVERVLEGGDGLGDVPAQPQKSFVHGGWRFEFGRSRGGRGRLGSVVGPHQNLLHHVVVGGGSAGPALDGCSHGGRPEWLRPNGDGNVDWKWVKVEGVCFYKWERVVCSRFLTCARSVLIFLI